MTYGQVTVKVLSVSLSSTRYVCCNGLLVRLQQYLLDNPTRIYATGDFGQNAPVEASEACTTTARRTNKLLQFCSPTDLSNGKQALQTVEDRARVRRFAGL